MQGLNKNFKGIPYYKKKETSQVGYQEANTQTNVQGPPMKKMIRQKTAKKFNNKKAPYHSVGT
jgi:hypothetical protein